MRDSRRPQQATHTLSSWLQTQGPPCLPLILVIILWSDSQDSGKYSTVISHDCGFIIKDMTQELRDGRETQGPGVGRGVMPLCLFWASGN